MNKLGSAALLCFGCSVFPDEAVLPNGQGGNNHGGSAGGFASGGGGRPDSSGGGSEGGSGGRARGGSSSGGSEGGRASDGGAGGAAGLAGSAGDGGNAGGEPSATGGSEAGGTGGGVAEGGSGGTGGNARGGQAGDGGRGGCAAPLVQQVPASVDAYITNAGSDDRTNFGDAPRLLLSGVAMSEARALLNFDWTLVPNQGVRHLTLRVVLSAAVAGTRTLSVYRVGRAWAEDKVSWIRATTAPAVNWSTEGGDHALTPSASQSITDAAAGTALELPLDSDALLLATPASQNYGLLLEVSAGEAELELSSSEALFATERPMLVLETCP